MWCFKITHTFLGHRILVSYKLKLPSRTYRGKEGRKRESERERERERVEHRHVYDFHSNSFEDHSCLGGFVWGYLKMRFPIKHKRQ